MKIIDLLVSFPSLLSVESHDIVLQLECVLFIQLEYRIGCFYHTVHLLKSVLCSAHTSICRPVCLLCLFSRLAEVVFFAQSAAAQDRLARWEKDTYLN